VKPRSRARRTGRALAWCAGLLLAVELIWLVAANALLALHVIPHLIARHSLNVALDYERALSFYPGDLRVDRFWIRGRDRKHVEWRFTVEHGDADVALLPLLSRQFKARWIHARGVTARFRKLESPEALEHDRRLIALSPPIEGFGPVARAPYGPEDSPVHPAHKRWTVDLEHTDLQELGEIWIGPFRFQGQATMKGRFFVRPRQAIEFGPATASIASGQVTVGDQVALRTLKLEVEATLARMRPGKVRRREILRLISGRVQGTLQLAGLESLRPLVPRLAVRGGAGPARIDVTVEQGLLGAGSRLEATLHHLHVNARRMQFAGTGTLRLRADQGSSRMALDLPHATIASSALPGLTLSGALAVQSRSRRIDLVGPLAHSELVVRAQGLGSDDLSVLDGKLAGVHITSGSARADGELHLFTDGREGHGALHAVTGPVAMQLGARKFSAALRLDLHLAHFERQPLSGDLGDSSVAITSLEAPGIPDAHGFWLTAHLAQATGTLGRHRQGAVVLDGEARDGRPILALLAQTGKLPHVTTRLFSLPHLQLHAEAQVDETGLTLSALRVAGGKTELLGALHKSPREKARGALLLRAGPLDLGVGLGDAKAKLHPVHGDAWFASQQQEIAHGARAARRSTPRRPR
jgi:hypothetical protein